jgi:hypothetical protein
MNWQVAASIATIIQAIVVIISLWLIWRQVQQQTIQIKQQTELTKIANTQALVGLSSPFNLELIKDAQMAALWVKGAEEYENFDEVKKYQYESLLIWWLIFHENIYYQWNKGLLDQQAYAALEADLKEFIKRQQLGRRWNKLKGVFQTSFIDHVTELISHP